MLPFERRWLLVRLLANAYRVTDSFALSAVVRHELCVVLCVTPEVLNENLAETRKLGEENGFFQAVRSCDFTTQDCGCAL